MTGVKRQRRQFLILLPAFCQACHSEIIAASEFNSGSQVLRIDYQNGFVGWAQPRNFSSRIT
jgi:hypothetical protein